MKTHKIRIKENDFEPSHVGEFEVKLPKVSEQIAVGKRAGELGGAGENVPLWTSDLCHKIAWLETVVVSAPDWWYEADGKPKDLLEFEDANVLDLLFQEFWLWRLLPNRSEKNKREGPEGQGGEGVVETGQEDVQTNRVVEKKHK